MKKYIQAFRKMYSRVAKLENCFKPFMVAERAKLMFDISSNIGVSDEKIADHNVTVSLTTFDKRIYECHLAIESLMHQTMKPNRIILWLDEAKYNDRDNIPLALIRLEKRGLEIRTCKDLKSYKKLIPALQQCGDDIIITVDDDHYYPVYLIERLVKAYNKNPKNIYFFRGATMLFDKDGRPRSWNEWEKESVVECSINNVPVGSGGVLYPPGSFHKDIFREDIFMELCPLADDIWFKAMSYLNGVKCERIECPNYEDEFVEINKNLDNSLCLQNVFQGKNDEQIRKVCAYYKIPRKVTH